MKRGLILGFIITVGFGLVSVAAQVQLPPIGAIEKLADNLYVVPGGGGNSAVYVAADGVVIVDTKFPDQGQPLLDRIRSVTDKPITTIINTHMHGDHTGANAFYPASVEIVTQENAGTAMRAMRAFQDAATRHGQPDRVFKDRLTLFSGNDAIDLYFFGLAHTNGDAFVVFRRARVMHAGDVFQTKATAAPYVDVNGGGSVLNYGNTIAKTVAGVTNVDRVITGHDAVRPWSEFVLFGEFNRAIADHARASLKAGKTPQQAAAEFNPGDKFRGYELTPPGPGARGGAAGNFTTMYQELQKQ